MEQVSPPAEVGAALLGTPSDLCMLYELVLAFELGRWSACEDLIKKMGIPEDELSHAYADAVQWVQGLQLT